MLTSKTLNTNVMFFLTSFGFNGAGDFLTSTFRTNDFPVILPVMAGITVIQNAIFYLFGIEYMELIALIFLFVLEIVSGIWASSVLYRKYNLFYEKNKQKMNAIELCEMKEKIERYRFSSTKLKRAGTVMGFWLIILFIIWQFAKHEGMISYIFNTAHHIFMTYIVSIYIVSVIENAIKISGSEKKFLPLKDALKNAFKQNNK